MLNLRKVWGKFPTNGLDLKVQPGSDQLVPATCIEISRLDHVLPPGALTSAGDRLKISKLMKAGGTVCFGPPEVSGGESRSEQTMAPVGIQSMSSDI